MEPKLDPMKIGNAGHAILADARRQVWAVRADFWDSFARLVALDYLPVTGAQATDIRAATRSNGRPPKRSAVAVVPLQGLITPKPSILSMLFGGGGGLQSFRESLAGAVADDDVDAIILDVDSPGGSTALVPETAAEIRAAREVKPVVAVANTDAGSAAYWLAAQADEVIATPSGMVGSVGAYIIHLDYSGMNEQLGIEPTYISAGRFKLEGNPDAALDDDAREHFQEVVDTAYGQFVGDLSAGRGVPEKTIRRGYGEGRMMTAQSALEAGLVDRIDTLEATAARLLSGDVSAPAGARAEIPSDRAANLSEDEANRDEAQRGKSPSQVARNADQALADSAMAHH